MCGHSNNRCNSQPCTILLIIVILANQGLLDNSPKSKNALTLLFLFWLCGFGGGCGNRGQCQIGNCNWGSMGRNQCGCGCQCKCTCKCGCCKCKCKEKKCKEKKCKCKRIKICCA